MVEWLLANGAEVNAKNDEGDTPLGWTLKGGLRMLTWWNCCASTVAMNEKQQQGLSVNLSANAVEIYK